MESTLSLRKETISRYLLAVVAAILALVLRAALSPLLGISNPYHTAWIMVVFTSWFCGVGPSVVAVLLSALGVWYWFLPPAGSFSLQDPKTGISGMAGFLIFSGCIIALGEANRRSRERSAREIRERTRTEQQLREREGEIQAIRAELENRVRERTAEFNSANANLRQLSARLLQMQDEERRRIARELHDSVGQLLAAIGMNLSAMRSTSLTPVAAKAAEENATLLAQISSEIRTISHLLHPPLLDEMGLASALRWYVEGFSERSKIAVLLDVPSAIGRLDKDVEIALFRVVQECLTNVHRHSGSNSASVRISHEGGTVRVEIKDGGRGIPPEMREPVSSSGRMGVGFRGMRERIAQLGGALEVQCDGTGTLVTATLPLETGLAASYREGETPNSTTLAAPNKL
jgi:signal transduction histidine kinase